ncbi:MAG: regulatory protein RecX [Cocleimonas sp.]|nr:regulatory protein RecX [Cocleimonas sp.]
MENYTRCYQTAIGLLARREHSRLELINKIRRKSFSENVDLISLCHDLEESNYLSEARFTEMFVRSRVSRGQGKVKISYELRQRGVDEALIDSALLDAGVDWLLLAKEQREKRFGLKKPKDYKERARQSRFLAGRGFSGEIIYLLFS